MELSRDVVQALDHNPELPQEMEKLGIARRTLRRFELLGRGQIHESLVFSTSPGGIKLITVPLSEQSAAITNGVEVLDEDETATRNIPVHELTSGQASQVIGGGRIRTLAEQRTWLRKQKSKLKPVEKDVDYRVSRDHVTTHRPGTWSKQLVLQWLVEMN